jgi:hypothetical protein
MAQQVTITVRDGSNGNALVEGANVTVLDTRGWLVASGRTSAAGTFVVALTNNTVYRAAVLVPKYLDPGPTTVTVVASAVAVTVTLTAAGIVEPNYPGTCLLFGFLDVVPGGEREVPVHVEEAHGGQQTVLLGAGAAGIVEPVNQMVASTARVVLARNGYWETEVLQGTTVRVYIPALNFEKIVEIYAGTVRLNIVDARATLAAVQFGPSGWHGERFPAA